MKRSFKNLPISIALILSLAAPLAMADDTNTGGDRDKAKATTNDKPDAYTVEDSKEKGLTSAKKPVRKLDHKQKVKGEKPIDLSNHPDHETSSTNGAGK